MKVLILPLKLIKLLVFLGSKSQIISFSPVYTLTSSSAPHPIFVIILVGPDETPFGIQKDLLCSQSLYYRQELAEGRNDKVEYVVKLPDTDDYAFGCFQNFLYTGDVYDKQSCGQLAPDYPILMGVWNLATKLLMPSLRVAVLSA